MASTGIDEALRLDAVYLTAPIPRNLAALTVLGAVFDKVYFPGVYLPKGGYDPAKLEHVPPELNRQDSHGVLDRRFYRH